MDLFAWIFDDMKEGLANAPEKLERVAQKVMQKQDLHIRKVDMKHFDRDVALVKQILQRGLAAQLGLYTDDRSRDGPSGGRIETDDRPKHDLHCRDR